MPFTSITKDPAKMYRKATALIEESGVPPKVKELITYGPKHVVTADSLLEAEKNLGYRLSSYQNELKLLWSQFEVQTDVPRIDLPDVQKPRAVGVNASDPALQPTLTVEVPAGSTQLLHESANVSVHLSTRNALVLDRDMKGTGPHTTTLALQQHQALVFDIEPGYFGKVTNASGQVFDARRYPAPATSEPVLFELFKDGVRVDAETIRLTAPQGTSTTRLDEYHGFRIEDPDGVELQRYPVMIRDMQNKVGGFHRLGRPHTLLRYRYEASDSGVSIPRSEVERAERGWRQYETLPFLTPGSYAIVDPRFAAAADDIRLDVFVGGPLRVRVGQHAAFLRRADKNTYEAELAGLKVRVQLDGTAGVESLQLVAYGDRRSISTNHDGLALVP